jgi:Na+-driven multidrug efflux pump
MCSLCVACTYVQGIWVGMLIGTILQTVILFVILFRTRWEKEVTKHVSDTSYLEQIISVLVVFF